MKILQISPRYRGGGAERCARELMHGLEERGHTVEMWTAIPEQNTPANVICIRPFIERLLFPLNYIDPVCDWRHLSACRRIDSIQPGDFDVVHLHNIHGHWMSMKALHRLCQRVPVVWTLHDEWAATGGVPYDLSRVLADEELAQFQNWNQRLIPLTTQQPSAIAWKNFLNRWMPQPKILISPSRYIANLVTTANNFPHSEILHLPYGLPFLEHSACNADRAVAKTSWNLPPEQPTVLVIASNLSSPYKGMNYAVQSLNHLASNLQNSNTLSVLILGNHSQDIIRQFGRRLHVVSGYAKTDERLCEAYRAADITLIPSIADNFPYVALESLSCETPIVCFEVGGLVEIIGNQERGQSVPTFHIQSMANTLCKFLRQDEARLQFRGRWKEWIEKECDKDNYLEKLIAIYISLAS